MSRNQKRNYKIEVVPLAEVPFVESSMAVSARNADLRVDAKSLAERNATAKTQRIVSKSGTTAGNGKGLV